MISLLKKPDKIFAENTNISYAIRSRQPEQSDLHETFLANQLSYSRKILVPEHGGLLTEEGWLFTVREQTPPAKDDVKADKYSAIYAVDNIEFGFRNSIPLWLFGFLY